MEIKQFGPLSGIEGYWGPITSSIDWCEQNYIYTHYIAEFWNTLSSLTIAFWAVIGIVLSVRRGLEKRFSFLYTLTILVGLGSAFFHGTLLYTGQMWDEIPMMWFIMSWGYILVNLESKGTGNKLVILGGFAYLIACSIIHYYGSYVIAFQVHFALLCAFTIRKLSILAYKEKKLVSSIGYFPIISLSSVFLAFAFWISDQIFCEHFYASGFNPQGHAIWHVLNSICIHFGVQYTLALRLKSLGHEVGQEYYFLMPYVVPKRNNHIS